MRHGAGLRGVALAAIASAALGCPKQGDSTTDSSTAPPTPSQVEPSPPPAPAPSPAPTAEPTSAASAAPSGSASVAGAERWLGSWESGSCANRKYPRWLTVAAWGGISGQERISPCPKGVACVWSGIVEWKGSYTLEGDDLVLSVAEPSAGGAARAPLPERLAWDAGAGAPVERVDGVSCNYRRRSGGAKSSP